MGLGVVEALRAAKKNKTIPVAGIDGTSEAIQAVVDGEFAATVMNDPMWQGGMGLSLAYQAKNGVFDPSKEPLVRRFDFTPVFVGKDNAVQVQQNYVFGIPTYAWDDLWGRVQQS